MEMPHIGKHCQLKSCNKLDYLPFNCKHCRLSFCLDHWKPEGHICSEIKKSQEITLQQINSQANNSQAGNSQAGNSQVENSQPSISQINTTGLTNITSTNSKPDKPKKKKKQNPCNLPNCSGYNLVKMGCGECGINFCVKHRFPEEHECVRRFNSRFSRLLAVN